MKPSYEPGPGTVPLILTVTLAFAPGASVTLPGEIPSSGFGALRLKLNVAVALPTLVIFRVVLTEGAETIVAGSRMAAAFSASAALSCPAPIALTLAGAPPSVTFPFAVFTTADLSCAGVKFGCCCFTSATAPATIGTAKLVPVTPA